MSVYHTVVPIRNVKLDASAQFEFDGGVVLAATPLWVQKDKVFESLSEWDRDAVLDSPFSLIATYEAAALGDPDPAWTGGEPKSIQEVKYEICLLANLALWLRRASPVCFVAVFHAFESGTEHIVQAMYRHSPLLCHPQDVDNHITEADIPVAVQLHRSLVAVARNTSLWTAICATWAGLQLNIETIRYALFWIALEALFGPEDAREITFRLSQRVALFLAEDRAEAKQLFRIVKKGYSFRSRIVHGRWKEDPDSLVRMAEVENLVRRSFGQILSDEALRDTFVGNDREAYLDDLAFA